MRNKHKMEVKYEEWRKAGYGNALLNPIQEQEIKRAFMGGVFSALNFVIEQMDNKDAEKEIEELYKFLRAFHENEVKVHKSSPFGD